MLELENTIERKLKREVERLDNSVMCLKLESPGTSGMPDRMILLPGGRVIFVELKRPGKVERVRQRYIQKRLRDNSFAVFSAVSTDEQVRQIVNTCKLYLLCAEAESRERFNEQSSF